ncbi:MAG TPA: NADP-dependent oxidoreductase [Nitrososphaerales archaeon]|nr:NADP-dependent oxidoreductase [Nitrososphaerales archaeon]
MKAIRTHSRGGPENLVYEDAPVPTVGPKDALIRAHAAGITPTEFTWNSTFTNADRSDRLPVIPAFEVSGTVEKTNSDESNLSFGDEVYGLLSFWRDGAAAEYVAARSSDMAPKPESLDFVHAAAVPLSGLTAWQALFDHAEISQGDRVLIHGAGGGVGSFAVQLAKWKGSHVIATCSKANAGLALELGASEVIDYTKTRFDDEVQEVDAVLDTIGGDILERSWTVLRRGGTLVTIVGDAPEDKAKGFGVNGVSMLVEPNRAQLVQMSRLIDSGKLRPIVSEVFPLPRAKEAYQKGLEGHNRGKLVLKISDR